jgi:hypothetical protein
MGRSLGQGKLEKLPDGTFRFDYQDAAGARRRLRLARTAPRLSARHGSSWPSGTGS